MHLCMHLQIFFECYALVTRIAIIALYNSECIARDCWKTMELRRIAVDKFRSCPLKFSEYAYIHTYVTININLLRSFKLNKHAYIHTSAYIHTLIKIF